MFLVSRNVGNPSGTSIHAQFIAVETVTGPASTQTPSRTTRTSAYGIRLVSQPAIPRGTHNKGRPSLFVSVLVVDLTGVGPVSNELREHLIRA